LPCEAIHFVATTQASFVGNPAEGLQAVVHGSLEEPRGACAVKLMRPGLSRSDID
jgi:hypothetical protein